MDAVFIGNNNIGLKNVLNTTDNVKILEAGAIFDFNYEYIYMN